MSQSFSAPFLDARAAWRRDSALLLPLAGLGFFLAPLAVQLLLPALPAMPQTSDEAAARAWFAAMQAWAGRYGIWYLLAPAIALVGALAVFTLYLSPERPTLGRALARAGLLFPRYLLASILVSLPMGMLLWVTLIAPFLLIIAAGPIFYIYGRTMLMGPAIVAEAPMGAVAAIARSWALTRGRGWILAATYATIFFVPGLLGSVVLSIGAFGGNNPVIIAITTGLACLFVAGGSLLLALVEVSLYRRLSR
ncbi:hypothetical protein ACFSC3_01545 [Sphingomonas floccifaciens]|uniref:ABC transporter permease n=1 Tax=Sphingomonas floccifaciens TaxID=1844115 RepID=A0ABW4NBZ4_9SPHN